MGRRRVKSSVQPAVQSGFTNAWYDYHNHEICLKRWTNEGIEVVRHDSDWCFFLRVEDFEKVNGRAFDKFVQRVEEFDRNHVSVFMPYYGSKRKPGRRDFIDWLRERGVEPLEADVDPVTRFLSDNIQQIADPRILFFDLETDPRLGFVLNDRGDTVPHPDMRVLSVSWGSTVDNVGFDMIDPNLAHYIKSPHDESSEVDNAEFNLLRDFFTDVVSGYDLLVAWNGDAFDEIVLKNAARRLGINANWRMVNFLDFMQLFKHPYYGFGRDKEGTGVKISYSLDVISQKILGHGKLKGVPGSKMYEIWRDTPEVIEPYNRTDVARMIELEQKNRYIASHVVLTRLCNRFPSSRTLKSGFTNDGFLLKHGAVKEDRAKIFFPTKQNATWVDDGDKNKIEGAFVVDPVVGLHEGVVCLDFGSLYPNIIRTFNISFDTRIDEKDIHLYGEGNYSQAFNGSYFRTDRTGVVAGIVEQTLERRGKYKNLLKELVRGSDEYKNAKTMSESWKVLQNAMYGLSAAPSSRIYDTQCGESVTITGQTIIKLVIALAQKWGITVVAGDTDSLFMLCGVKTANDFIEAAADLVDEIVEERGGRPGFIRLGFDENEDVFSRIFWVAKKRYAGQPMSGGTPVIKGLETIRTDGCKMRRDMQRSLIDAILSGEVDQESAISVVNDWKALLYSDRLNPNDIVITEGVSKQLGDYKVDTAAVRVAKQMLKDGREVFPGMKIPYIVKNLNVGGTIGDVVHIDDFDGEFDRDYYWQNKIYPATQRILESVFPKSKHVWERLQVTSPNEKQKDMFEKPPKNYPVFLIVLRTGDEKLFPAFKAVLKQYSGNTPVEFKISGEDDVVVSLKMTVEPCAELVDEVEDLFGHRCYYGSRPWAD
jgi:DNA polymerase elongation subunit (family B)